MVMNKIKFYFYVTAIISIALFAGCCGTTGKPILLYWFIPSSNNSEIQESQDKADNSKDIKCNHN